jgi:hypothetical protein
MTRVPGAPAEAGFAGREPTPARDAREALELVRRTLG